MNPVVDLAELAARIEPGARLGLCADYGGVPMAALFELIRQRQARELHVVCVPTGGLHVDMAGSGDVWSASVNGPLDVKIAGPGDVKIAGGKADAMTVSVAGSGGVDFAGTAASLKARIAGSGDVKVKAVTGEVSKAVVGSGEVRIG